ncbi:Glutamine synthetase type I [Lachnospiraceae bacterium TWA4]|nr:Glutamine synthetase type I [Lachnospiraceae bacterium TWA4]
MSKYTREDILNLVDEEDVEFIRLQFVDMFGVTKNVAITARQLEKALDNKFIFDGSAIEGFVRVEESDMYLYPNLDTFQIFPWRPQQGKVARLICDVYRPNRTPFEGDPRYILKKVIKEAKDMGYIFNVGPECEFFLFHCDDNGLPTTLTHEQAGYFDMAPVDLAENVRRDIILNLEDMEFEVEASHHEMAPGQHEIDFKYSEVLDTADNITTFKMAVKAIAKRHGLHATFMPKPVGNSWGSGMHLNMSLSDLEGNNLFSDPSDEAGLSRLAYYFLAGIFKHVRGLTAIANPIVNSYKRLLTGFDAPLYIAWSSKNRSPLIRVPLSDDSHVRLELRSPDCVSNPYLTLAVCLAAGLDGIKNQLEPPKSVDCNLYQISDEKVASLGLQKLPQDLGEAIEALEEDKFIQEVLGEHLYNRYIQAKKTEWKEYCIQVTDWELNKYLRKF